MIRTTDVNDRIFSRGRSDLELPGADGGIRQELLKYLKPDSVDARPVVAR